jgi:hypothetical protein
MFSILTLYQVKIIGGTPLNEFNGDDSAGIAWLTKEELLNGKLLNVFHKFSDFF